MSKLRTKTVIYLILAFSFTGISSYADYHCLESGSNFHELSTYQRNLIRVNQIGTIITNPVAIVTIPYFVGGKPRPRKDNYAATITLFLSLIPSFLIWKWLLVRRNQVGEKKLI